MYMFSASGKYNYIPEGTYTYFPEELVMYIIFIIYFPNLFKHSCLSVSMSVLSHVLSLTFFASVSVLSCFCPVHDILGRYATLQI